MQKIKHVKRWVYMHDAELMLGFLSIFALFVSICIAKVGIENIKEFPVKSIITLLIAAVPLSASIYLVKFLIDEWW